jgi:CheY-like chemotaxis protein
MARRLKVLVADDHEAHRRLLHNLLTALGCAVMTVPSGEAAVSAAGPFDLICLDRHMPGMGGEAAARALQGSAYLVACTSDPDGLGPEFDAVLAKPFGCCELAGVLEAAGRWRRHVA